MLSSKCQFTRLERNSSLPDDERMTFRIGINMGDVIVEGGISMVISTIGVGLEKQGVLRSIHDCMTNISVITGKLCKD